MTDHVRRLVAGTAAALTLAFATAHAAAQTPERTVTLDEAVHRALENSPQMAQAAGSVESAEWSQRRAGASYVPNLSVSSSAGVSGTGDPAAATPGDAAASGVRESYGAGVSASVDLYTGGRRSAELQRARADVTAAEAALTERRYATVLAVQRSFYDVARAADLAGVAQARVEAAEQALSAAERRMQVGSATTSDVLRAELEVSRARQALLAARHQERAASLALGRAVGEDGPVGVRLMEAERVARPLEVSDADLVNRVVGGVPTIEAAEAALRAADAGTRVAASQYLPRVQLSTGYDWSSQAMAFDAGRTGWSVRVGVSLPIFDGFQREASVAEARTRATAAQMQLADARRAAVVDAERLVGALRLAEAQIALAEDAVRMAEEDLRVQQTRYGLNASTMLDQIASQTALAEARQSLVAARYDHQIARAELEALAGRSL